MAVVSGCRFCLKNNVLDDDPVAQTGRAYLLEVHEHPVDGCYLIIPIEHFDEMLPDWWQGEVNQLLRSIPWYKPGVPYNTSTNFGKAAGQRVPHLHQWFIPRINPRLGDLGLAGLLAERLSP
jgi:diadenosine tetraphosphate (Ap4A) HIT family hydrolase